MGRPKGITPNLFTVRENCIEIHLSSGESCYVDKEDYEQIKDFRWYAVGKKKDRTRYVYAYSDYKIYYLHKLLMNPTKGFVVDHIDGDGFNNRRSNLRICSNEDNLHNSKLSKKNATGYKGVSPYGDGRFVANITKNYKSKY